MKARILLVLAGCIAALPAFAAPGPGSSPARAPTPEELRMLHELSRCMVKDHGKKVERLLAMDYRSAAYAPALRSLARDGGRCFPYFGALRMSSVLLAGGLAEASLPAALNGSPLAQRVAYDPSKPAVKPHDEGEYLGLCAVRTMPDEVAALLATAAGSAEEATAAGVIAPKLAPCVQAGASARINRPGLRALFALAAYRLVTGRGLQPAAQPGIQ